MGPTSGSLGAGLAWQAPSDEPGLHRLGFQKAASCWLHVSNLRREIGLQRGPAVVHRKDSRVFQTQLVFQPPAACQ